MPTVSLSRGRAHTIGFGLIGLVVVPALSAWSAYVLAVTIAEDGRAGNAPAFLFLTGLTVSGCSMVFTLIRVGSAARLDGSAVTVRVLFRRRRVDIARARAVWFGQAFGPDPVVRGEDPRGMLVGREWVSRPHLVVLPADGTQVVRVPLTVAFGAQPRDRLEALAAVVETAPAPPNAAWVAAQLRAWPTRRRPV